MAKIAVSPKDSAFEHTQSAFEDKMHNLAAECGNNRLLSITPPHAEAHINIINDICCLRLRVWVLEGGQ